MKKNLTLWFNTHASQLAVLNIYLVVMVLLRSAGYFEPYLTISINFIFFSALLLAVLFLQLRTKEVLTVSLVFWFFAGLLVLSGVNVWAQRLALYTYESLALGVILLLWEAFKNRKISSN